MTERYETFAVDGFRLGLVPDPPPKLLVAALRPGMLRLAGRESDGAILNWLAPGDVATVTPCPPGRPGQGDRGPHLRRRHRRPGAGPRAGPPRLTAYLNVPVYRAFHQWLGRGERLAPMWRHGRP